MRESSSDSLKTAYAGDLESKDASSDANQALLAAANGKGEGRACPVSNTYNTLIEREIGRAHV